jgi:hypothetical protein
MSHIKITNDENKSWCNEILGIEFYFKDAEHAALNGIYESKSFVCGACIDAIVNNLEKKREPKNENDTHDV